MCISTNQYSQFVAIEQLCLYRLSLDHGENYIYRSENEKKKSEIKHNIHIGYVYDD
jgi:hypothetical protein